MIWRTLIGPSRASPNVIQGSRMKNFKFSFQWLFLVLPMNVSNREVHINYHTSCICHNEACQRALWAHLAQNSIPTWNIEPPIRFNPKNCPGNWQYSKSNNNNFPNWMERKKKRKKRYGTLHLQQRPLIAKMCQTFRAKAPLHPAP